MMSSLSVSSARTFAVGVVALLMLNASSVSSQGTCGILASTDIAGRAQGQSILTNADECCEFCQNTTGCTVSVYDSLGPACYLISTSSGTITEDILLNGAANAQYSTFFPSGQVNVAQAAAEQEDGGDDIIDTVWNYSTATLAGIGAGIVGGLILIGCLLYAYCRSRNAKRAYQLNSAQV